MKKIDLSHLAKPAFLILCALCLPALLSAAYPKHTPAWHMKKHASYPKEFKKRAKVVFTKAEPFGSIDTYGEGLVTYNLQCRYDGGNYGDLNLLVSKDLQKRFEAEFLGRADANPDSFGKADLLTIEGWIAQANNGRVQMMFRAPRNW